MKGDAPATTPKVLRPLAGRGLAAHVLHALAASGVKRAVVVLPSGESGEQIKDALLGDVPTSLELAFAEQEDATGTADAVLAARSEVDAAEVLVVNGDLGLITREQIAPLLAAPAAEAVLATAVIEDPARMGRILRDPDGEQVLGIVEYNDASDEQRAIRDVNVGIYRFKATWLWEALERIAPSADGERNATSAIGEAAERGTLRAVVVPMPDGRLNVETPADLLAAARAVRARAVNRLEEQGVLVVDPSAVWIDATVDVGADTVIEPGCHLRASTRIGAGSRVGPNAVLHDVAAGEGCVLESCTIRGSTLGDGVKVGPYSTVREGCELGEGVRIGTHAELKDARLGPRAKVGHFSYLGDVDVGAGANIGAGAITCNYDGEQKHRTTIGEGAFIGSDTLLIPPIEIGDRARTGAGSVVTKDVPADGNAVGHPARLIPRRGGGGGGADAVTRATRE